MSGLQGLIGYEGCCCGGEKPCLTTLCGLIDTANNGSIRELVMPPLFDAAVSFTLSVGGSPAFGCVALTPYSDGYYEWVECSTDDDCCCDVVGLGECVSGGGCEKGICEQVEYGDYHPEPTTWFTFIEPAHICIGAQQFVNVTKNDIIGSNLAQHVFSGDFTYPYNCVDLGSENGCNNPNYCDPPWTANFFPMFCAGAINIDGSVGAPAHTNYALITAFLRVLNPHAILFGVPWYPNRPPCDCKCPYMELTVDVSGVIFYSITDVLNQPPLPVDYSTLSSSMTTLTYRKRLVRSKALNYYTYYDWINDTTEPFHLFMIQSGEDGVHEFCEQDAIDGTIASCTAAGCPDCVSTGGSPGSGPTVYIESYELCSSASSETSNAPGIGSASCYVYPDEIQLSIAANYPPIVTGISPLTGTTAGGTIVTITGTGMWGCHQVTVDNILAPSFNVNNSSTTSFGFTTPAHSAGTVQVVCTWSWGTSTTNFTYV